MVQNRFLEAIQKEAPPASELIDHPILYRTGDIAIYADLEGAAYVFKALKTWATDLQKNMPYDALRGDKAGERKLEAWNGVYIVDEDIVEEALRHMYDTSGPDGRTDASRFHALFNQAQHTRSNYLDSLASSDDIPAVFHASQGDIPKEPHAKSL